MRLHRLWSESGHLLVLRPERPNSAHAEGKDAVVETILLLGKEALGFRGADRSRVHSMCSPLVEAKPCANHRPIVQHTSNRKDPYFQARALHPLLEVQPGSRLADRTDAVRTDRLPHVRVFGCNHRGVVDHVGDEGSIMGRTTRAISAIAVAGRFRCCTTLSARTASNVALLKARASASPTSNRMGNSAHQVCPRSAGGRVRGPLVSGCHCEELPVARHALEFVRAVFFERYARADDEVGDRS
jgi:hypothetical protein